MTRRKMIIIAIVAFVFLAVVVITVSLLMRKSPEPLAPDNQPEQSQETPTEEETTHEEASHETGSDDHDHGDPYPADQLTQMRTNAQNAVEAYVGQPASESASDRKNRLEQYFASSSTIPKAKPPAANAYTVSTIVLESEFTPASKPTNVALDVFVKTNINSGYDAYSENQTWYVELTKEQGVWLVTTIKSSSRPYIEAQ